MRFQLVRRRWVAELACVVLLIALCAWRIVTVRREPVIVVTDRAVTLMDIRVIANATLDYARKLGRQAYYLDSVEAHLTGRDSLQFHQARYSDNAIGYGWTWCTFGLMAGTSAPPDSTVEHLFDGDEGRYTSPHIEESFVWPRAIIDAIPRCKGYQ